MAKVSFCLDEMHFITKELNRFIAKTVTLGVNEVQFDESNTWICALFLFFACGI